MAIQVNDNVIILNVKDMPCKVRVINDRKEVKEYKLKHTKKGNNVMN